MWKIFFGRTFCKKDKVANNTFNRRNFKPFAWPWSLHSIKILQTFQASYNWREMSLLYTGVKIVHQVPIGWFDRIWEQTHVWSGCDPLGPRLTVSAVLTPASTYWSVWCFSKVSIGTAAILVLGLSGRALAFLCFYPLYTKHYIEQLHGKTIQKMYKENPLQSYVLKCIFGVLDELAIFIIQLPM